MIDDYVEHLPPLVPPEEVHEMSRFMLAKCPVVHSDQDQGFWMVNRHEDLVRVMQDNRRFHNGNKGVRVPHTPVDQPPMPPIDSNPPMHRQVREVMNPYLTPAAITPLEPEFRKVIGAMIDEWVHDGECDLATQLAKKFPSQITAQFFLGVQDLSELEQLRHWVRTLSYEMFSSPREVLVQAQQEFVDWATRLVESRKAEPRTDIVSALLAATVEDDRKLTDQEIVGAIQILVLGGFSTTADATCNIVIRLIEDPALGQKLREHPEMIPAALEEIMRLEPPVTARPRVAMEDVEIDGHLIRKGERLLCNYLAANVDPQEWERAEEFIIDRKANRVMTFGAGPHRCIGSHQARALLRIMTEELLKRITNIKFQEGMVETRISFNPSAWRACDSLPITFTPLV